MCVCERERERRFVRECVCVSVCACAYVCVMCVCVCVCVRERERERDLVHFEQCANMYSRERERKRERDREREREKETERKIGGFERKGTPLYESCHTHKQITSHTPASHVTPTQQATRHDSHTHLGAEKKAVLSAAVSSLTCPLCCGASSKSSRTTRTSPATCASDV